MKRLKFTGLTALFATALLAVGIQFAYAHHTILTGKSSCPGPDHVVAWSIANSQPHQTIVSFTTLTATMGGVTYPVTGYTLPIAVSGHTSATSTVPGSLTGTITLSVAAVWSDGHKESGTALVALPDPCPTIVTTPTTTPTTVTTPTTPKSTPTTPTTPGTDMTGDSTGPTTPACVTPPSDASTAPKTTCLAYTGSSPIGLGAVGVTIFGLGGVMLMAAGFGLKRRFQP